MADRAPTDRARGAWQLTAAVVALLIGLNLAGNLLVEGVGVAATNLLGAAALVGAVRLAGIGSDELGLEPARLGHGLRVGGVGVIVVALVVVAGLLVPPVQEGLAESADDGSGLWVEVLLRIPLGTALPEEVLFRGVLLAVLARHTSTTRAVAVSSLVFGLWHVLPTLDPASPYAGGLVEVAVSVAATTVAGVGLCWLRLRSGSLLAPTMVHWGINSAGLLAAAAARGG